MLNFDSLRVIWREEEEDTYFITVEEAPLPKRIKALIPICAHCLSDTPLIRFGTRTRKFHDLPMHGKRVVIIFNLQRWRCLECGKTVTDDPGPEMDDKRSVTCRFRDYVVKYSAGRTFVMLAHDLGVHEKTIRNILKDHYGPLEGVERIQKTPTVLGIDEVHLLDDMRCVITDIEASTIYDMLATRGMGVVTRALKKIPFRERIKVVTMDMHKPYRSAVRAALPDAVIVVDKYHVLKDANKNMDKVRIAIRDLHKKERIVLKRGRFKFLKRAHRLNPMETVVVDSWSQTFPQMGDAYRAKEQFFGMYDAETRAEAEERYMQWLMDLSPEMETAFASIITFMENWGTEIFNYFDHRFTNATTEALNGIIKIANRNGRGVPVQDPQKQDACSQGSTPNNLGGPPGRRSPSTRNNQLFRIAYVRRYHRPCCISASLGTSSGMSRSTRGSWDELPCRLCRAQVRLRKGIPLHRIPATPPASQRTWRRCLRCWSGRN